MEQNKLTEIITQEEVENIKNLYFKKLALENLIGNITNNSPEAADDSLLVKYGNACAEYTEYGENIKNKYFDVEVITSWSCDFNTGEFTITL